MSLLAPLLTLIALTFVLYKLSIHRTSLLRLFKKNPPSLPPIVPISVNYHFSRKCNYSCGFCFHTAKTSHIASLSEAKQAITMLHKEGMRKLNFAGGEPLLYPRWLGEILRFCKEEVGLESISIVTNGSKLSEKFMEQNHKFIDIIAVSCDSFDEETNIRIGRGSGDHLKNVERAAELCRRFGVRFKLNTVVNRFNFEEDMNEHIQRLKPFRWKCFQVLVVPGENRPDSSGNTTLRDATDFLITDEEFDMFCAKHSQNACFVAESNKLMKSSYILLDEYLRFIDRGKPGRCMLEVGVQEALKDASWDQESFQERGGIYDWTKSEDGGNACSSKTTGLDW